MKHRVIAIFVLILMTSPAHADWFKYAEGIMGTPINVELWAESKPKADRCSNLVMDEMRRIDQDMSPWIETSELYRINVRAAERPVKISAELFNLIERSLQLSELSGGAFDITFASIGFEYDYRQKKKPSDDEIKQQLDRINYHHIHLDKQAQTISFDKAGVKIDLGGIAKGHAVDNAIRILHECGIDRALVSAGGDSRIIGDKGGRPWMTGIRDPRDKTKSAIVIPLSDTAVSTSGDYERYFIQDGVRYHHIISPKTGKSVHSTRSVTILGPDATTTDGLSTTIFVLGPQKGLALVEKLTGIDAVIIDAQGKIHYSSGLQPPSPAPQPTASPQN